MAEQGGHAGFGDVRSPGRWGQPGLDVVVGWGDGGHRVHARAGNAIGIDKDTGIGRIPSHQFKINQAWLTKAMTAQNLLTWLRLLARDGDLARSSRRRNHGHDQR
jgi:hypothetical protein